MNMPTLSSDTTTTTTTSSSSSSSSLVPYYVLEKSTGHTEVLFLVPTALVPRLMTYPILCHGATFPLRFEDDPKRNNTATGSDEENNRQGGTATTTTSSTKDRLDTDTTFLAVDFVSPAADDLAQQIAIRLTRRIDDAQKEQQQANHTPDNDPTTYPPPPPPHVNPWLRW
jgi:hypothetical protein